MVRAETDINLMESNSKMTHEHRASLTDDGHFLDNDQYLHDISGSDVESVPAYNSGNTSMSNRSGKLYNYDDYLGSIDMYPGYPGYDQSGYDYGKKSLT